MTAPPAANHGDAEYQAALTLAEAAGDPARIVALLHAASAAGSGDAAYALASSYLHDTYLAEDAEQALAFLRLATERGHPAAMYDLGSAYAEGAIAPGDDSAAFDLFFQAALLGDRDALEEVVRCLYHGTGIRRNMRLYELAADMLDLRDRDG